MYPNGSKWIVINIFYYRPNLFICFDQLGYNVHANIKATIHGPEWPLSCEIQLTRAWFLPVHTWASLSSFANDSAFHIRSHSVEFQIRMLCGTNPLVQEVHLLWGEGHLSVHFITWINSINCRPWCKPKYTHDKYTAFSLKILVPPSSKTSFCISSFLNNHPQNQFLNLFDFSLVASPLSEALSLAGVYSKLIALNQGSAWLHQFVYETTTCIDSIQTPRCHCSNAMEPSILPQIMQMLFVIHQYWFF